MRKVNGNVGRVYERAEPVGSRIAARVAFARSRLARPGVSLLLVCLGAFALLLGGCGGGGSSTSDVPVQAQIREARKAGEEAAREKDRLNGLEKKVRRLSRQVHRTGRSTGKKVKSTESPRVSRAPAPEAEAVTREFHVESGNVSCRVEPDGAMCTVEPISESFSFSGGGPGRSEPGSALPENLGEVVPYGSSVSVGQVVCEIPPSYVPRGIVCSDAVTGHGFEASRVASRQKVY